MAEQVNRQAQAKINSSPLPMRGLLQRKCACGNHTAAGGECAECRKKRLQRKTTDSREETAVPPLVHEVLRSPGRPLDPTTRAFMEPRFGHDFSQVRVHTDGKAAESAHIVNAMAYTVGHDIVFGEEQYTPTSSVGRHLIAHELTHVVQQQNAILGNVLRLDSPNGPSEQEANKFAFQSEQQSRASSMPFTPMHISRVSIQRLSSDSSSSSGGGGGGGGPTPAPGTSCMIDVRATHIAALGDLPIWHLFIVYTDGVGTEYYYRGGPGGTCMPGDYGSIITTHGPYKPGTVDWNTSAPSERVLEGISACGKDTCLASELARIDSACTPYNSTGPNSNTVVSTLLNKCSIPRKKPVFIAPGWGDPDI